LWDLLRAPGYGVEIQITRKKGVDLMSLNPLIAIGVVVSTATTDAVYVLFNAAVSERRRIRAASWSGIWYLLSAFAVISYTQNVLYLLFAATGSWIGAFCAVTWLQHESSPTVPPDRPSGGTA
jgi:uncharacterized membrane protein YhaH (DUF805 family)